IRVRPATPPPGAVPGRSPTAEPAGTPHPCRARPGRPPTPPQRSSRAAPGGRPARAAGGPDRQASPPTPPLASTLLERPAPTRGHPASIHTLLAGAGAPQVAGAALLRGSSVRRADADRRLALTGLPLGRLAGEGVLSLVLGCLLLGAATRRSRSNTPTDILRI